MAIRPDRMFPGHRRAKLWELTDLSATEFADEAARFCGLKRVALQENDIGGTAVSVVLATFLREMMVFPYQSPDGHATLAVADPTDDAAQRAAQIVLGAGVVIRIATSEDLALVLNQRLGEDDVDPNAGLLAQPREDDIESLRDLASGAPGGAGRQRSDREGGGTARQ